MQRLLRSISRVVIQMGKKGLMGVKNARDAATASRSLKGSAGANLGVPSSLPAFGSARGDQGGGQAKTAELRTAYLYGTTRESDRAVFYLLGKSFWGFNQCPCPCKCTGNYAIIYMELIQS